MSDRPITLAILALGFFIAGGITSLHSVPAKANNSMGLYVLGALLGLAAIATTSGRPSPPA